MCTNPTQSISTVWLVQDKSARRRLRVLSELLLPLLPLLPPPSAALHSSPLSAGAHPCLQVHTVCRCTPLSAGAHPCLHVHTVCRCTLSAGAHTRSLTCATASSSDSCCTCHCVHSSCCCASTRAFCSSGTRRLHTQDGGGQEVCGLERHAAPVADRRSVMHRQLQAKSAAVGSRIGPLHSRRHPTRRAPPARRGCA